MIIGILILTIVGMITAFSIQNVTTVSVSLLYWSLETTLPTLVCVAVLLGVILEQLVRQWTTRRSAKVDKS